MPNMLTGVQEQQGCKLTAGDSTRQQPVVTTANESPSIGHDFSGPFIKRNPGPGPRIEVKQEWTAMRIETRRDLLADVGASILDVLAQFNPRSLTGAREVLQAIVTVKDTILGLIEPGHWSIKQDWEFSFDHEGGGNGVVLPGVVGTGWKNDAYFTWDVSITTSLNGVSRTGACTSPAAANGLTPFSIDPPTAFSTTLGAGINTVKQVVIVNVHFVGYEDEFRVGLDALQQAVDWLGQQIREIYDWFQDQLRRIRGEPGLTPEQVQQREEAAAAERKRREDEAAASAAADADEAKGHNRRAADRVRKHRGFLDVDYSDAIVICAAGTLEQLNERLTRNAAAAREEKAAEQTDRVIEENLKPPPPPPPALGGPRGVAPQPGPEMSSNPDVRETLQVMQYEHKLKVREMVLARLLATAPAKRDQG